ncbi:Hypothetical protein NTJ_08994 [Nesidiocoris tenuis]|uniref:Uncharacterized protein n=1 Tax=Nesidiocoris tenuis TaxID=355587 RepID=A0ABN7AVI0_9HEMI|nr:Hypothetical protein NTJ_08994 [Nesidiocoris tenuis]
MIRLLYYPPPRRPSTARIVNLFNHQALRRPPSTPPPLPITASTLAPSRSGTRPAPIPLSLARPPLLILLIVSRAAKASASAGRTNIPARSG